MPVLDDSRVKEWAENLGITLLLSGNPNHSQRQSLLRSKYS